MSIDYNKLQVTVDCDALRRNYELLNRSGGHGVAVIKSDAYGHGLRQAYEAFSAAGAAAFAVGTIGEGLKLRSFGCSGRIIALLGVCEAAECPEAVEKQITPLIYRFQQLDWLEQALRKTKTGTKVSVALKFDTGMARLGFASKDIPALAAFFADRPALDPVLVCSHLATADDPAQEAFVLEQIDLFESIITGLRMYPPFTAIQGSLANTAGLLAFRESRYDWQRPGIGLYGSNPFFKTDWAHLGAGLQPAMEVTAPILQIHELAKGRSASYGRTFYAPKDMRVAVVATGYADCYNRGSSSKLEQGGPAEMLVHGKRAAVLGRVCMQMTVVDVSAIPEAKEGDRVHLLGGKGPDAILAEELADWWGTIPYEIFCVLGLNPRAYQGESSQNALDR